MFKSNQRSRVLVGLALFALVVGQSTAAFAATETNTIAISATVVGSCSISGGTIAFGNYDPVEGADVSGSADLTVICSSGTSWTVSLDKGQAADFTTRTMDDGSSNYLNYNLFTNVGHTTVFGDGSGATSTSAGTGTGSSQTVTVYGLIPSGQNTVPVGSYSESITATITY